MNEMTWKQVGVTMALWMGFVTFESFGDTAIIEKDYGWYAFYMAIAGVFIVTLIEKVFKYGKLSVDKRKK